MLPNFVAAVLCLRRLFSAPEAHPAA